MQEKENSVKVFLRRLIILKTFFISGIKVSVLKPYWHNRDIVRVLFLSAVINFSMWGYLFAHRIQSDYPIILHYNLFFGVDFLGSYDTIFLLPLIGLTLFLINAALGQFFYKIERLASYILTFNILIIQLFLMVASYLVIRTNG